MQGSVSLPEISSSMTPLPAGHNIPIKDMYNIAMRNNTAWGIEGYQVPKEYLDSRKLKEVSSNTVKRAAPRALKQGDYLTETIRATKDMPAPNKYDIVKPWFDKTKQKQTAKYVTKKNSYIDLIIHESKKRPTPGPGAHNLAAPIQEMKKKGGELKTKGSEKVNFLSEMEYCSNMIPGPGNYNPRQIEKKIKENKMAPEDWKKKHVEDAKRSKSAVPANTSEKTSMPFPVAFNTFGKLLELSKDKTKTQTKAKIWGTSERFVAKKDAKKAPNSVPGPGHYPMAATWNGKLAPNNKDKKDKNWMNKITKGIERSIYYS